ncbi:hypothetical protein NVP1050O_01 [Vibrio phage 1.050.O._10N.286.48.A6]|nr:hypothetical protein NVP1050O_01 [Vibrio phage 1.050.O._10N.286.48.A6]
MAINKQQFGRAFRINNSFLPFEQWEQKHRCDGNGFTRPRGKKYAAAIDRYNSGSYCKPDREGVRTWLRQGVTELVDPRCFGTPDITVFSKTRHGMSFDRCVPTFTTLGNGVNRQLEFYKDGFSKLRFAATNATNAMVEFGEVIHNLGDRVRDEINDFPDIPGEVCSVELTRKIRKVYNAVGTLSVKNEDESFTDIGSVNNFKFNARPENFSSVIEADPTIIYLRKLLSDLYCYNTAPSVTIVEGQQLAVNEPAGAAELRVKIDERMATILDSNFDNMTTDDVLLRLQQSSKDLQELYPQEPLNWDDKLTDNFNEIFGSDYDEDSQQS